MTLAGSGEWYRPKAATIGSQERSARGSRWKSACTAAARPGLPVRFRAAVSGAADRSIAAIRARGNLSASVSVVVPRPHPMSAMTAAGMAASAMTSAACRPLTRARCRALVRLASLPGVAYGGPRISAGSVKG